MCTHTHKILVQSYMNDRSQCYAKQLTVVKTVVGS